MTPAKDGAPRTKQYVPMLVRWLGPEAGDNGGRTDSCPPRLVSAVPALSTTETQDSSRRSEGKGQGHRDTNPSDHEVTCVTNRCRITWNESAGPTLPNDWDEGQAKRDCGCGEEPEWPDRRARVIGAIVDQYAYLPNRTTWSLTVLRSVEKRLGSR